MRVKQSRRLTIIDKRLVSLPEVKTMSSLGIGLTVLLGWIETTVHEKIFHSAELVWFDSSAGIGSPLKLYSNKLKTQQRKSQSLIGDKQVQPMLEQSKLEQKARITYRLQDRIIELCFQENHSHFFGSSMQAERRLILLENCP